MERYIGLDVHSQSCTLAVVGQTGKRIGMQVVETNGAALKQAMRAMAGAKHVCLEEGTQICGARGTASASRSASPDGTPRAARR